MKKCSFVKNFNMQNNFSRFLKFKKTHMATKTKEDLIARIHKHNINTVTMVSNILNNKSIILKYIGLSRSLRKICG